jgi:enamine deaminase RidA (YjgF/YER057c/UK114 family)
MSRDTEFTKAVAALGYSFDGEIKIGGKYVPLVRDGNTVYISGQIPRVQDKVVVTGRAGAAVTLAQAQTAAKVCAMRALALLQRALGSLENVRSILRVTVYVQCTDDFTQHSEVADAASELLFAVLGPAGAHTRTSVGVYQLPKNATVELDLVAVAQSAA